MDISDKSIKYFQQKIIKWYEKNGRNFPWREKNLSNYEIIISEVLLQRTKAATIANFYPLFINTYPSWEAICNTTLNKLEDDLKPIGLFKQRAARLKKLAENKNIFYDNIPKDESELQNITMVGQYIKNAIMLFIHNEKKPLLDVNMARVLERFFGPRKLADIRYDPYLQELASRIVKHKKAKEINWGILDYATLICKKEPKCVECILKIKCTNYNDTKN